MIQKMKITPDENLATTEAIEFRIQQLRKAAPDVKTAKRIERLKQRLPKGQEKIAQENVCQPYRVPASVLVSKRDTEAGYDTRYVPMY